MKYSPQQTQHYANQAKCISIHTSMLAYVVQWAIAAYFIQLLSLSGKKTQRNSFERVENTIPIFLAILILHDWWSLEQHPSPLPPLPLPLPPPPRWDMMEEQTSIPSHHHLQLCRRRIRHVFCRARVNRIEQNPRHTAAARLAASAYHISTSLSSQAHPFEPRERNQGSIPSIRKGNFHLSMLSKYAILLFPHFLIGRHNNEAWNEWLAVWMEEGLITVSGSFFSAHSHRDNLAEEPDCWAEKKRFSSQPSNLHRFFFPFGDCQASHVNEFHLLSVLRKEWFTTVAKVKP